MARVLLALAVSMGLLAQTGELNAQTAKDFFDGKTIKWVVPYRPGGGYDQYSRLLAPFIERHSGASVEIINMPGAGGMKGAVEIYRSPPDALHLGIVNGSGLVANEIAGHDGLGYEVAQFSYVARITAEERVFVVGAKSGVMSVEDALATDMIIGTTGRGGSSYVDSIITMRVLGADWKLIQGFDSSADLRLAILRGDIHGMWGSYGSAVKGIVAGDLVPILRAGVLPIDELQHTPTVGDLANGEVDLLGAWQALAKVGRPVVGPPGIPEDRLASIREILELAINDAEFVEKAHLAKRGLSFLTGEETEAVTGQAGQMSVETKQVLSAALNGKL